jgi:drug/metabolite transporter, DME family
VSKFLALGSHQELRPMTFSKISPVWIVLLAVLLWSSGGLLIKMTSITGYEVNLGRSFFAAITVALLTKFAALKADRHTFFAAIIYAGILSTCAVAYKMTTAANAIFLQYTAPIYILVLAPFILKEKFKVADLITVAVCLLGMSLFFVDAKPSTLAPNPFWGNILSLLSGACLGIYILLLRHPKMLQQNPASSVFYGNVFAMVVMIPFVLPKLSPWTNLDLFAVVVAGVFQIGLAYYLFTLGIRNGVKSFDASIIGFIEPLLNPVWVFLQLGEKPSPWALVGGLIIITAVIAHTLKTLKRGSLMRVGKEH